LLSCSSNAMLGWLAGSQHQEQLSSAAHAYFTIL